MRATPSTRPRSGSTGAARALLVLTLLLLLLSVARAAAGEGPVPGSRSADLHVLVQHRPAERLDHP